jgi:hypothetical protein
MTKGIFLFIFSIAQLSSAFQETASLAIQSVDTVIVSPTKPTTNDSLIFTIRGNDHCCCTQVHNKKITVTDSTITLFASFNDENCQQCDCANGFNAVFSNQPIKAGKYQILYSEDIYCPPGKICAAIAFVVRNVPVGEITIRPATTSIGKGIESKKNRQKSLHSVIRYSSSERKLILKIQKPQYVVVTAYIVNGEKSTQFSSRKYLQAGIHSFHMDKERFNTGVAVIHVQGENFSEVQMINFAK